jgi:hypothetical protein
VSCNFTSGKKNLKLAKKFRDSEKEISYKCKKTQLFNKGQDLCWLKVAKQDLDPVGALRKSSPGHAMVILMRASVYVQLKID